MKTKKNMIVPTPKGFDVITTSGRFVGHHATLDEATHSLDEDDDEWTPVPGYYDCCDTCHADPKGCEGDCPCHNVGRRFKVRCSVSGGVTGYREAYLKKDGKEVEFSSREEAEAEARKYNQTPRASLASFRAWVEEI
jgi:hypothetical protein